MTEPSMPTVKWKSAKQLCQPATTTVVAGPSGPTYVASSTSASPSTITSLTTMSLTASLTDQSPVPLTLLAKVSPSPSTTTTTATKVETFSSSLISSSTSPTHQSSTELTPRSTTAPNQIPSSIKLRSVPEGNVPFRSTDLSSASQQLLSDPSPIVTAPDTTSTNINMNVNVINEDTSSPFTLRQREVIVHNSTYSVSRRDTAIPTHSPPVSLNSNSQRQSSQFNILTYDELRRLQSQMTSDSDKLNTILRNVKLRAHFRQFLAERHSEENIDVRSHLPFRPLRSTPVVN